MKKILYFIPYFASGGAEAFIVNTIEQLDKDQYSAKILCIKSNPGIYDFRLMQCSVEVCSLVDEKMNNPIKRYFKGYRKFNEYITAYQNEIDVIHFNIAQGEDLPFIWMSKRARIPIRILHSHNSSVDRIYKLIGHFVCKKLFRNTATNYCACSELAARWLIPHSVLNSRNYRIIENGIDTKRYSFNEDVRDLKRKELCLNDKVVLLNVGRLDAQKNQKFLIEAFAMALRECANMILLIVGRGELERELKLKIEELGIKSQVLLLGSRNDVNELLCASDIFVLTSLFEGLPFTIIEAQAAGLPCLISDKISEQCALTDLVQRVPLEVGTFAKSIIELQKKSKNDRCNYHEIVYNAGFDICLTIKQLGEFYDGVMENNETDN